MRTMYSENNTDLTLLSLNFIKSIATKLSMCSLLHRIILVTYRLMVIQGLQINHSYHEFIELYRKPSYSLLTMNNHVPLCIPPSREPKWTDLASFWVLFSFTPALSTRSKKEKPLSPTTI